MAEKKTEKWKSARTKNLSESQAKQAKRVVGGGRMEKVTAAERKAAKDFVNIGSTKWMTAKERGGKGRGGLLVDSSGKAVTGTVKLPSGQSAMYVRGKRIGVARGTAGGRKTGGRTTDKTGNPPPKTGARYEERKGRVGAMTPSASARTAGSVRSDQGKMGGGSPSPSSKMSGGKGSVKLQPYSKLSVRGFVEGQQKGMKGLADIGKVPPRTAAALLRKAQAGVISLTPAAKAALRRIVEGY